MLWIKNRKQEIVLSNFWDLNAARRGSFFLSIKAGAARLLVPDSKHKEIMEMKAAKLVILSRGPWPEAGKKDAIELLFEDYSDVPYSMHLGAEQISRPIPFLDDGRDLTFSAWSRGAAKLFERPAKFRMVKKLPHLKSWP